MSSRIGAIVIRVRDLEAQVAFWKAALDYVERFPPEDDWVTLRPRTGHGVNLSFDRKRSEYALPPRLHLDLYAEDLDAEVDRLVGLGAREVVLPGRTSTDGWRLLEDPEGTRFDVAPLPIDAGGTSTAG